MTRSTCWVLGSLVLACAGGCATPEDGAVTPTDTGTGTDSGVVTDSKADAPAEADTKPECTSGGTDTRACGKCGKQQRTCTDAKWGAWGACGGEPSGAECSIGEKRDQACGNCGKSTDTCDATECTWILGPCTGEGECAPGEEKVSTASCTTVGEVRTFTCDDKCAFSKFGPCGLPKGWVKAKDAPTGFVGRYNSAVAFSGKESLIFGGLTISTFGDMTTPGDGASYDAVADSWTSLPSAPIGGRAAPCGVFGKGKFIVWGGMTIDPGTGDASLVGDGALYDPVAKSWSTMSTSSAPTARTGAGCTFSTTTNQMIVWGGCTTVDSYGYCGAWAADGAVYDVATNVWTKLPTVPSGYAARFGHTMVWSGSEAIMWGGGDDTYEYADGLRFDPTAKSWTTMPSVTSGFSARLNHASAFTGKDLIVYGGSDAYVSTVFDDGGKYTPSGSWSTITSPTSGELPTPGRTLAQVWYGASKVWIWSGMDDFYTGLKGGAAYDPVTDKWTTMSTKDEPIARTNAMVTWTGDVAFVWGGLDPSSGATLKDGAIYRP